MFDLTLARPADAIQRERNFNAAACNSDDHERRAILTVACVAGFGVLSAAFLVFADDGNTPRFDALFELAIAALRCDVATDSSRHHECLYDGTQAAPGLAASPTVLARR
jgi:hypothetical protein